MLKLKKVLIFLIALALIIGVVGCGKRQQSSKVKPARPKPVSPAKKPSPAPAPAKAPSPAPGAKQYGVIETSRGRIVFELYPNVAPKTVASFIKLASSGFYNGTKFHRVVPGFVIQGGDPNSKNSNPADDGTGGPGYTVPAEFSNLKHVRGTVAMARAQDINSAGSQFYVTLAPQPSLDGQYTIFGQLTQGLDIIDKIQVGDVMSKVYVTDKP